MNAIQRRFAISKVLSVKPQKMSAVLCRDMSNETYSERQAKKGRPVSPHVTIYKFPVVALSSITNRVTGAGLSVGMELRNIFLHLKIFVLSLLYLNTP